MRIPSEINRQGIELPKIPAAVIVGGKLGLWLALTLIIFYFLFHNVTGQFTALFCTTTSFFNLKFLSWIVLFVCLSALWLVKDPIWQAMQSDKSDSQIEVMELVQRFFGLDLILTSLLILMAYPLPPAPDFLILRMLIALLAGFVLVFGRRATLVPAIVIATYGVSLLSVLGLSALMV